ncbi:MAG: RNA methyltransferase [Candidatus Methanospirareceae archaeon]
MEVRTILVEPKNEENIGAVARVIKNFGFSSLFLVKPREKIGEKAFTVASHAVDILQNCNIVDSLEEAIRDASIVVGTTSKPGVSQNKHLRMPFLTPRELRKKVEGKEGVLCILFGREDIGLKNEELKLCDIIVCIPTHPNYAAMNVSHAAAIILYELSDIKRGSIKLASKEDKERLYKHIEKFFEEIEYRKHKREKTLLMLRRIFGRAELTSKEVRTLRGILSKAEWKIRKGS